MAQGGTYAWTYRRMENLPILQDFVPCRGRCPKSGDDNDDTHPWRTIVGDKKRATDYQTDGRTDAKIEMRGRNYIMKNKQN